MKQHPAAIQVNLLAVSKTVVMLGNRAGNSALFTSTEPSTPSIHPSAG